MKEQAVQTAHTPAFTLERVNPTMAWWSSVLGKFAGHMFPQGPGWLDFVLATQGGEPVCAAFKEGDELVGCFTGVIIEKFGLRILGSPFPGWSTPYMGMALAPRISRSAALEALCTFAFQELRCAHLEMMDRHLQTDDLKGFSIRYKYTVFRGYEVDLTATTDELFANMSSACRRCIRKAEKSGVRVEVAQDLAFADEYHTQLQDVFAKQNLVPTYDVERVKQLIRFLGPSGRLLLLRASDAEGRCIATGIFPAISNDRAYFWGMASWREFQILRPNELLLWHAMQYWKARGLRYFDMGGSGAYKKKYGGYEIAIPWLRVSQHPMIAHLREAAEKTYAMRQKLQGRWRTSKTAALDFFAAMFPPTEREPQAPPP